VQRGVKLLHLALAEFAGGLDQGVEGRGIERLRVLLVPPHGPGADQGRLGFAVEGHLDGPSLVVFVLDHAREPLLRQRRGSWIGSGASAAMVLFAAQTIKNFAAVFLDRIGGVCGDGFVRCFRCMADFNESARTSLKSPFGLRDCENYKICRGGAVALAAA
jgi:hypothetical protein